jgi:predicted lipid-binding transport protein (Tim44 family)
MKFAMTLLTAAFMAALALMPDDADAARRFGGGRSSGVFRQVTPPPQRAPSRQQAAPAGNAAQNGAVAQPRNRWLGPLTGLAAGLGLGWLLSQGGFGSAMAAIILALLAGLILFAVLRIFARPRQPQHGLHYAPLGGGRDSGDDAPVTHRFGGAAGSAADASPVAATANVPPGFDSEGFVRQAKLNFMRLQAANDRGDLATLRDVTTEELYQALSPDFTAHGAQPQQTDISELQATLLEVVSEGDTYWASVSFQGLAREDNAAGNGDERVPFHEVWHLRKPAKGDIGWLLAGIQQVS